MLHRRSSLLDCVCLCVCVSVGRSQIGSFLLVGGSFVVLLFAMGCGGRGKGNTKVGAKVGKGGGKGGGAKGAGKHSKGDHKYTT